MLLTEAKLLVDAEPEARFIARLQAHSKDEVEALLGRAESVFADVLAGKAVEPIQFVLHGDEVPLFFRRNYLENRKLVDNAARLDAFDVIDIKVCETWMRLNGEVLGELYPFIETVPLGPAEEGRLVKQGYIYF